jgi:hypothetical protein
MATPLVKANNAMVGVRFDRLAFYFLEALSVFHEIDSSDSLHHTRTKGIG